MFNFSLISLNKSCIHVTKYNGAPLRRNMIMSTIMSTQFQNLLDEVEMLCHYDINNSCK